MTKDNKVFKREDLNNNNREQIESYIHEKTREIEHKKQDLIKEQEYLCCLEVDLCYYDWVEFFNNSILFDYIDEVVVETVNFFYQETNDWELPQHIEVYKNNQKISPDDNQYPDFLKDWHNEFEVGLYYLMKKITDNYAIIGRAIGQDINNEFPYTSWDDELIKINKESIENDCRQVIDKHINIINPDYLERADT